MPADGDSLVLHEVAEALAHGHRERIVEAFRADEVVVDVGERDPCGGARGHVHLHHIASSGIEEDAGDDSERRAAVPHLVDLLHLRQLSERQEALREDRMRVGDVVAPGHDAGHHFKQTILAWLHRRPPLARLWSSV